MVQDTNGVFYGTTSGGGRKIPISSGIAQPGTVFSLSAGLEPFVETKPSLGRVGQVIEILGSNLNAATAVAFNGTPASFSIVSSSLLKATVPVGATSGSVQVVTATGTFTSIMPFTVRK